MHICLDSLAGFFFSKDLLYFPYVPILLILAMRRNEEKPALKSLPSALKSFLPYGLVWVIEGTARSMGIEVQG